VFASTLPDNQNTAPASLDLLLVRIAAELYALPSGSVREVIRYRAYTPIPGAPPVLPGILSQRGAILPVVVVHSLLGLDTAPPTRASRLVFVSHGEIDMALLVEAVLDLVALPVEAIEPVPAALDPARARLLRGIGQYEQQPVALLNLDELIAALRA
jgi:purine-binding chemotaxis protein CheW